jgi:hypothetical protein
VRDGGRGLFGDLLMPTGGWKLLTLRTGLDPCEPGRYRGQDSGREVGLQEHAEARCQVVPGKCLVQEGWDACPGGLCVALTSVVSGGGAGSVRAEQGDIDTWRGQPVSREPQVVHDLLCVVAGAFGLQLHHEHVVVVTECEVGAAGG